MNKLDIHDIAGLTRYAVNRQIVPVEGRPRETEEQLPEASAGSEGETAESVRRETGKGPG